MTFDVGQALKEYKDYQELNMEEAEWYHNMFWKIIKILSFVLIYFVLYQFIGSFVFSVMVFHSLLKCCG